MSYHDGYDRPRLEGMAVVNPLIEIQRKLDKIKELVGNQEKIADLSAIDLKKLIEEIIQG
tara:strand:- start:1403 stop:1582 length:180 start_codon:yes stop_codon:yes gene_type:complete